MTVGLYLEEKVRLSFLAIDVQYLALAMAARSEIDKWQINSHRYYYSHFRIARVLMP